MIVGAEIEEMVDLDGLAGEPVFRVVAMIGNPDEAGRVAERQGADEKSVDDAEDSAAGADSQTDDKNGKGGKSDVTAEGAEGIFEVARKGIQRGEGVDGAGSFVWRSDVGHKGLLEVQGLRRSGDSKVTGEILNN